MMAFARPIDEPIFFTQPINRFEQDYAVAQPRSPRTVEEKNNMGRPINKKYIGNTGATGQQIQVTAHIPGDPETCTAYIVKQVATNTYRVSNVTGFSSGRCQLVNGSVALQPGQANVMVTPFTGPLEFASEIRNRTVTTFQGNTYIWVDSTVTVVDGEARLQTD